MIKRTKGIMAKRYPRPEKPEEGKTPTKQQEQKKEHPVPPITQTTPNLRNKSKNA